MNITDILNPRRQNKPKLLPLKIRQSVLAHLLKQNHDVRIVQVFAGHRKAASTEEYKQTGLEELKTAVGKYHPHQDEEIPHKLQNAKNPNVLQQVPHGQPFCSFFLSHFLQPCHITRSAKKCARKKATPAVSNIM